MHQVNIHEAKTHLSRLLEEVETGEEVIIARNGKPIAQLCQIPKAQAPRKPGGWEGKVWMADDFDDDAEIVEMFSNSKLYPEEA